jgi:hypothetical protein
MEEKEASSHGRDEESEGTNVVTNQQEQHQRMVLARDYGKIARLAARFDGQVKQFVGNMNSMVTSIPIQDELANTWDEHAKTNTQDKLKGNKEIALDEDKIRGDEAKAFDTIKLL